MINGSAICAATWSRIMKRAKYLERLAPSGEHRKGNQRRQKRRADRADVRNVAQQECDHAPQRRARQTEIPGHRSGGDAVRKIDQRKKKQVAANRRARGFKRLRRDRNSRSRRKPDKSIAQILSAVEQKKQQHDDQQRIDYCVDDWQRPASNSRSAARKPASPSLRAACLRRGIRAFHATLNVSHRFLDMLKPWRRVLLQRR